MKKKEIHTGIVERTEFPNKGYVTVEGEAKQVIVKNTIPGQTVEFQINKIKRGCPEGRLLKIINPADNEIVSSCEHFGNCGGCTYRNLTYKDQLALKEKQVRALLGSVIKGDYTFEDIKPSPTETEYRNKMEFSFGDEYKDGPLALGMHKRGSFYDIVNVEGCKIVDEDYRKILKATKIFFETQKLTFYHRMQHIGYLRHLLVRKGKKTGEILIDLITTTEIEREETEWCKELLKLELDGTIVGILHTHNDAIADVVRDGGTKILYGRDYFYEELLGLKFKISPFSFFQTNSLGAEVLYETTRGYIGDTKDKVVFDLYSGTGTIAQIIAPVAKKVVGVEIVEEASAAAKENAALNNLDNCDFITGDVLKVIDEIPDKPDIIILDPPRDGIHPKALEKIINFGVNKIVYVSCKPTSLARDLEVFQARGYKVEKVCPIDEFPGTVHVESVVLLTRNGAENA